MLALWNPSGRSTLLEAGLLLIAIAWTAGNTLAKACKRGMGFSLLPGAPRAPRSTGSQWNSGRAGRCTPAREDAHGLDEALAHAWNAAAASPAPVSMLMIQIDEFEQFHARYGRQDGDACLLRVLEMLRSALKPTDLLAEVEREGIAVLLPGCNEQACFQLAEKLRRKVACAAVDHDRSHWGLVTISVGCATMLPTAGGDGRALLAEAKEGLRMAKQWGRNRLVSPLTISPQLFPGGQQPGRESGAAGQGMRQTVAPGAGENLPDAPWFPHSALGEACPSATMVQ